MIVEDAYLCEAQVFDPVVYEIIGAYFKVTIDDKIAIRSNT
jgi:hypothetical protein